MRTLPLLLSSFVAITTWACTTTPATDEPRSKTAAHQTAGGGDQGGGDQGSTADHDFVSMRDANGFTERLTLHGDTATVTLSRGSDTTEFTIAADGAIAITSSTLEGDALKAFVVEANGAFGGGGGGESGQSGDSNESSDLNTESLHPLTAADPVVCESEGQSFEQADTWVTGGAIGGLVGFLEGAPAAGFIGWATARQARNQASEVLGRCCYRNDPNFNTRYCNAVYWLYWPLSVPGRD